MGDMEELPRDALLTALIQAMDSAGLGCTIIVDDNGTLRRVYASAHAAHLFGTTVDELIRQAPLLPVAPPDRECVDEMCARGSAQVGTLDTHVTWRDGSTLPVEVWAGNAQLGGGREAVVAFVRDRSNRGVIERALRESEERFRSLAESCPDGIVVYSEGRLVYANPHAMGLFDLTTKEALAQFEPLSVISPVSRPAVDEQLRRLEMGEEIQPFELRVRIADGSEAVFDVSASATTFDGVPALVAYGRDMTARLEVQARLMQHDRLAAVGTLVAGLAHELNNPLTYLDIHARALREGLATGTLGDPSETLRQIADATQRLKTVIGDLLFMARDSDARQAHVDVKRVLESTLSLVSAGAAADVRIVRELADCPPLYAHPNRLGQVFLNVLLNAMQAVEGRADGTVTVALASDTEAVSVSISDNGAGVPEDVRTRVFDPFFTSKPQGTGLGLSISRAIVVAHGGRISLDGVLGGGTRVTVTLPLIPPA